MEEHVYASPEKIGKFNHLLLQFGKTLRVVVSKCLCSMQWRIQGGGAGGLGPPPRNA